MLGHRVASRLQNTFAICISHHARCVPCSLAYNSKADGHITKGGYSDHIVVREEFMLHVPDSLSMAGTAPLLCAGITGAQPPPFMSPLTPASSFAHHALRIHLHAPTATARNAGTAACGFAHTLLSVLMTHSMLGSHHWT